MNEEVKKENLKKVSVFMKILKVSGGIFLLLIIFIVLMPYFFIFSPTGKQIDEFKPNAVSFSNEFLECFYIKEAKTCNQEYFTEKVSKVNANGIGKFMALVKNKLGNRLVATLIDDSWDYSTLASTKGTTINISFSLKVEYEKDANVVENYYLKKVDTSPFKIHNFKINSDAMLE